MNQAMIQRDGATLPDCVNVNQVFFTNLQLLGFDPAAKSAMYAIPFNRDMFNLPNKKGYEVVVHFLFSKLNLTMCREQFRDCWPIRDKKSEQVFNRTVCRWMTDIAKEEPDSYLPRIVPSLFLSPGGEKFNKLLFYFSTFVVHQQIKHGKGIRGYEMLKHPVLTRHTVELSGAVGKAIQCDTVRQRNKFLKTAQESVIAQKQWQLYASDLVKEYRHLSKHIRELEHQKRDVVMTATDRARSRGSPVHGRRKSHSTDYDVKAQAIKRAQRVQKVREMWRQVDRLSSDQAREREVVESVFQSDHKIDGNEIDMKVPELLLRECEQEIQRRRVENTFEGGKLNLLSLLQLWNLSLHLYIEKLREVGVPHLELSAISTQVHTHHSHLNTAETFRNELSKEVIPNLRRSIEDLHAVLDPVVQDYVSPVSERCTSVKMDLTAPTPPMSFTPDSNQKKTPVEFSTKVTAAEDISTPDAVCRITDGVTKLSRKTQLFQASSMPHLTKLRETTSKNRVTHSRLPTKQETKPASQLKKNVPSKANKFQSSRSGDRVAYERKSRPGLSVVRSQMESVENGTGDLHNGPLNTIPLPAYPTTPSQPDQRSVTPSKHKVNGITNPLHLTPAKSATPKAHELLADKIADAVIRGSPFRDSYTLGSSESSPNTLTPDFNLENPMAALDRDAFISKDLIERSPPVRTAPDTTPVRPAPLGQMSPLSTPADKGFREEIEHSTEVESPSAQTSEDLNAPAQKLLDSSNVFTQMQTLTNSPEHEISEGLIPTASIQAGIEQLFLTNTPQIFKSRTGKTAFGEDSVGVENTESRKSASSGMQLNLSDEFEADLFHLSPPDLRQSSFDRSLGEIFGSPLLGSKKAENIDQKGELIDGKQTGSLLGNDSLLFFDNNTGWNIPEVFSSDSLNLEGVKISSNSEAWGEKSARTETRADNSSGSEKSHSSSKGTYKSGIFAKERSLASGLTGETGNMGKGDGRFQEDGEAFVPLEHGLQISSPHKTKQSLSPLHTKPVEDIIARYKTLRKAASNDVHLLGESDLTQNNDSDRAVAIEFSSENVEAWNTYADKDLFTLDVEKIDLKDSTYGNFSSPVHKASPRLSVGKGSFLDSFLEEEDMFLVPSSPGASKPSQHGAN